MYRICLCLAAMAAAAYPSSANAAPAKPDAFRSTVEQGLSEAQIDQLALLAQVWGFTKYHHPLAVSGKRDWDAELFTLLPRIAAAKSRNHAASILNDWLIGLGPIQPCSPCAQIPADLHLQSPVPEWLDGGTVPEPLAATLKTIFDRRQKLGAQHYLKLAPDIRNALFINESGESGDPSDPKQRLLGLFRYWNAVLYWFPYRDVIARPWTGVLKDYVPLFARADEPPEYASVLRKLSTEIGDGHSSISMTAPQPSGAAPSSETLCALPVGATFLDDRLTVERIAEPGTSPLRLGDIVLAVDGRPIPTTYERIAPNIPASNESWRKKIGANFPLIGECGKVSLDVLRGGKWMKIEAQRTPIDARWLFQHTHDLDGETFQMLGDVAYLKLSSIKAENVPTYMDRARSARGLVIDIRNYPSDFMPFVLGPYLVDRPTLFSAITRPVIDTPGAFEWTATAPIEPVEVDQRYTKPVVVLVDELSMSQSEYTAMAFRAGGATIIGSTTAGADGNVSTLQLPTGWKMNFTGLGIFYPDRRPTQRLGIVPDIHVRPTPEGIAAGRDEVLERALEHIRSARPDGATSRD